MGSKWGQLKSYRIRKFDWSTDATISTRGDEGDSERRVSDDEENVRAWIRRVGR